MCTKVQIVHYVSDYFMCKVGVRQGENLTPLLFSIYINDLENYLLRNDVNGFNCPIAMTENYMFSMLKLFILLYDDDTFFFIGIGK